MYHWETGTDADVLRFIVSGRAEDLECGAEDLEYQASDNVQAGPLAMLALPQALALVTSNWSVIEQIAKAALSSPAALPYQRVVAIAADKVLMDPAEYQRWDRTFRPQRVGDDKKSCRRTCLGNQAEAV